MKKLVTPMLALLAVLTLISACATSNNPTQNTASFDSTKNITVVSREDGSGTRRAFIELLGILVKADGTEKDHTTKQAIIANQTGVMLTNIENDTYAIGYVSLGSLNENVKALSINGVPATAENVKNGTYPIARPFIIATKSTVSEVTQDFIDFILSNEGQTVVAKGYTPVDGSAAAYSGSKPSGKIVVAGSSSVTPIMEKLKEAYIAINPNADIEIQMTDSSAGMTAAIDGTCDIGMASRALKESELAQLNPTSIAIDGIAVIVNPRNTVSGLTSEQVKAIFTGEATAWSAVID